MDERRARAVLAELARELGDRAILWRGFDPDGSDVDLLVAGGAEDDLAAVLAGAGLTPGPGDPGHLVWIAPSGEGGVELDVLPEARWPAYYPPLGGVRSRLLRLQDLPPVASVEDRLLILAAEAVAGRRLEKIAARADSLLALPGAERKLADVAAAEGLDPLARLVTRLARAAGRRSRPRLPFTRAAAVALRSPAARAALGVRLAARRRGVLRRLAVRRSRRGGLLVALSGMDGSGKSSAASAVEASLREEGVPVTVAWARFGQERGALDRIARPVKRLLRREGTTADPVAAGGPSAVEKRQRAAEASGRRGLVSSAWIAVVAAANARRYRRIARPRRGGTTLVCDRWLADSLVDLELRYGRHRLAERLLRQLVPRPDLAILLSIDAETSLERKPGDQAERVLTVAERLYAERAAELGLEIVDARGPAEQVAAEVSGLALRAARERLL